LEPIVEGTAWLPEDLVGTDAWVYQLSGAEVDEVIAAADIADAGGREIKDIGPDDFALPKLGVGLADIKAELKDGRGFALIRGLPVEGRSLRQVAVAFWGLGLHVGAPKSQNGRGHLLGHVMDIGADASMERGYMTNSELAFHTDRADVLSLCCVQAAKSGGAHRICSSVSLHNEMLKRRPELAKELAWDFYRTRTGEIPAGETSPWFRQPIFSVEDGHFTARGASLALNRAQGLPGVPDLTEAQRDAIKMFQTLSAEVALDLPLQQGDVTYCNCHVTLHGRANFEDWPEATRKRHLLRLWLSTNDRPLVESIAREMGGVLIAGAVLSTPLEAA
jgi:hypothetical protein